MGIPSAKEIEAAANAGCLALVVAALVIFALGAAIGSWIW